MGKHEQVEDIEVSPILMRKGQTTIALYPLGAIRDERLVRGRGGGGRGVVAAIGSV